MKVLSVALEALDNIMTMDKDIYSTLVEEAGGLDHLERLQSHANQDIYEKCVNMIEKYWEIEKEGEPDKMDQDAENDNQKMEVVDSNDNKEEEAKIDDN